jgi:serine/threonine-protein kinase
MPAKPQDGEDSFPDSDDDRFSETFQAGAPAEEVAFPPGDARYSAARRLGEGAMGEVLLVQDSRIGRDVALKKLQPGATVSSGAQARLEREARVQGQLEHPAIVPVYDIGTAPDGSLYFTMKRVRGRSLASVLRRLAAGDDATRQRFTRRRLLSAFSQVCLAAHFAHEHGVVHRDIKPANIMFGDYGEVYLLDWGEAKLRAGEPALANVPDAPRPHFPGATLQGDIIGTPGYMSPEQAQASTVVDRRADVFALGAVLFEILTLERLIPTGPVAEQIARTIAGVDARPSVRTPKADVPPELEAICVAATRRDPEDRLATTRAIHDAVEAFLDGDRDLQMRRALAESHSASARAAYESSVDPRAEGASATEKRADALREVGKALALDSTNRDALRTLVRLLAEPPRQIPREVDDARKVSLLRQMRAGALLAAVAYFAAFVHSVALVFLHVRDWTVVTGGIAMALAAVAACLFTAYRPSYVTLFGMFLVGIAGTTWFTASTFGPHVLFPCVLMVQCSLWSLARHRGMRVAVTALSTVAWVVGMFGGQWGLLPNPVRLLDHGMFIEWKVVDFGPTFLTTYLFTGTLALIIIPAFVIGLVRDSSYLTDLRMRLMMWQLQQLVPAEASDTIETSTWGISKVTAGRGGV